MFTGIVQGTVKAVAVKRAPGLITIELNLGKLAVGLRETASVSVAGVCLTVKAVARGLAVFDLMGETIKKTTLGRLGVGDRLNIERSAKIGDEIGGHRVSGHVTGTALLSKVETPPGNRVLRVSGQADWMPYIFPKGFIALDGSSLTVVDVGRDWFTVHLIPETLRITTFGEKKKGDRLNLELDAQTVAVVETVRRIKMEDRR